MARTKVFVKVEPATREQLHALKRGKETIDDVIVRLMAAMEG